MSIHLLIAPPASGKTQACLDVLTALHRGQPLAQSWLLVPDRLQADAARLRLARQGAVFPVKVATFGEMNAEILERSEHALPLAGDAMLHRLLQEAIRSLNASGHIPYYAPICATPGFLLAMRDRIDELKQALVQPEQLLALAQARGEAGLEELAKIYAAYQARLQALQWADDQGQGWLAHDALLADEGLLGDLDLLLVDGFEAFNPAQLRTLCTLAGRADETWITLPGRPGMPRPVERRFRGVAEALHCISNLQIETLPARPHLPPTLGALEASFLEPGAAKIVPGEDFAWIEAHSPHEEGREALRWLKARILRDGLEPAECALAVPELDSYRASLQAAADEFGLPLRFSQGPLLGGAPPAAAVLDLLRLVPADFPLRPLLDTIRAPYFNLGGLGLRPADAFPLEIASLYGQVVQGLGQWQEVLGELARQEAAVPSPAAAEEFAEEEALAAPQLPLGPQAAALLAGLQALAARLAPPPGARPLKEWAAWLLDLLESLDFFEIAERSPQPLTGACGPAFEHLLLALGRSEALTGPCPVEYPDLLKEWEGLLAATCIQEEAPPGAIRVLRLLEVRGLRLQALAVLGLAEGSFPAVERPDPFLGEDVRRILGLEPILGREQAGLFYLALTRPERCLLLTRPYLAKDGESWEPSPFWEAIKEIVDSTPQRMHPDDARPLSEAASSAELLFWAARRQAQSGAELPAGLEAGLEGRWQHVGEMQPILAARLQKQAAGPFDGGLEGLRPDLAQRYGAAAGWSASRLESYAACPHSFFASSALGLEVRQAPQEGYQVNQLGSMLHGVLEEVYRTAPDPADTLAVLASLPEVARRAFAEAPHKYQFRPSRLWEVEQEELLAVLEAAIQGIADLDAGRGWVPLAFELSFGLQGQPPLVLQGEQEPVRLHGIIDRVDRAPDGSLRVIDYKSGSSHQEARDLLEGRRLQLPLYAAAAQQALGLGVPSEGFYWALFAGRVSPLKLASFEDESGRGAAEAIRLASEHVAAIVDGIRQGAFEPRPPQGGCPSYCPAAAWCWHYQPGRTF